MKKQAYRGCLAFDWQLSVTGALKNARTGEKLNATELSDYTPESLLAELGVLVEEAVA